MSPLPRTPAPEDLAIVAVDQLRPHPDNPRRHAKATIKDSMQAHGVVDVCVVQRSTNLILGGNGRWESATDLGEATVPVLYVDCDDEEAAEILLVLNAASDQAGYDLSALTTLLDRVRAGDDVDRLKRSGWTEEALARVRRDHAASTPTTPETTDAKLDQASVLRAELGTEPGQVWKITGTHHEHRLVIGDATDPIVWDVLMAGQPKAACVFTDPPYGISYEAPSGAHDVMVGDDLRGDALIALVAGALKHATAHAAPTAGFYVWHAPSTRDEFAWALKQAGLVELAYIVWAKPSPGFGYAQYRHGYEPCFYAALEEQTPAWYGDNSEGTLWRVTPRADHAGANVVVGTGVVLTDGAGNEVFVTTKAPKRRRLRTIRLEADQATWLHRSTRSSDVWEVARDAAQDLMHPTQKPVELATRALENSTKPGDLVVDPFAGSGSTLLAAEATGRRGGVLELSADYAAVILARARSAGMTLENLATD